MYNISKIYIIYTMYNLYDIYGNKSMVIRYVLDMSVNLLLIKSIEKYRHLLHANTMPF